MNRTFLFSVILLGLISCTSKEEPIQKGEDKSIVEISDIYENYKSETQEEIGFVYNILAGKGSRSNELEPVYGEDLIHLIISLPDETIDSLYNQYFSSQTEQTMDSIYDASVDELLKQSSAEEIQQLYQFTNLYIENGGHNMEMLANAIKDKTPIVQNCMICCAANIDEYILTTTLSRTNDEYCLRQLTTKMAESAVQSGIMDIAGGAAVALIAAPGADVVIPLFLMGYDLYSAIKVAHEYNRCVATHIS